MINITRREANENGPTIAKNQLKELYLVGGDAIFVRVETSEKRSCIIVEVTEDMFLLCFRFCRKFTLINDKSPSDIVFLLR